MTVQIIKKGVLSSDGIHTLAGTVYVPSGEIKGIFHIVHGMTEYMKRYEPFMMEMAQQGYLTFGYDNLGHGNTVNSKDERGFFAYKGGWKYLADDTAVFAGEIRREYGQELPYYLMGHSMGSFIARLAAAKFDLQDKLIIMGTGGPQPLARPAIDLLRRVKAKKGERYVSKKALNLVFGSYNLRFEKDNRRNWLTKDKAVIKAFDEDELCDFQFSVSALEDLLVLSNSVNSTRWFDAVNKSKPILLLSGAEDPVGNYGKGVKQVFDRLQQAGANAEMILYPDCRHEILNDSCHDEVVRDILAFLEK